MIKYFANGTARLVGEERLHYLSLVVMLVRRELKVKYRDSVLGYVWSLLNPLLFMIVITLVFSNFFKNIENYNLYVLSGILIWNASASSLNLGTQSIVNSANLLRKVKMPIWVFPIVSVFSTLTNMLLALVAYLLLAIYTLHTLPENLLFTPVVLFLFVCFLVGCTLILSSLNVFFRDVGHVLDPVLTIVFYATPVIYDRSAFNLPKMATLALNLNPFTHFVEAFRACVTLHGSLTIERLFILFVFAACSMTLGALTYKNTKKKMIFHL